MESDSFKKPEISVKPIPRVIIAPADPDNQEVTESPAPIQKLECPYTVPPWSQLPNAKVVYGFEVLKNGVIVENVRNLQLKPYWVFGRLDTCHIVMAHPTISRFHAVLQYRINDVKEGDGDTSDAEQDGWYLYDMNSTHGTFLNKMRIKPNTYVPIRVGHMIQLGASTRKYILQGPEYDEEEESELSVTQLKEQRIRKQQELQEKIEQAKRAQDQTEKQIEDEGISWGMGEDADEESDLTVNPYASTNNEELFLDDPKKTLRGFFEREGFELDYKVDEMSAGSYVVRIELPIDDANGYPLVAEVSHKGKKKDAVFQGALEACRILDRQGVLRRATHEPRRKRQNDSESDDDEFLDRTGDIQRKRQKKTASTKTNALSYNELIQEENELVAKLAEINKKIDKYLAEQKASKTQTNDSDDDLDNFMSTLEQDKRIDKTEIKRLRLEEKRLKEDHLRLQKIIKIAAPAVILPLIKETSHDTSEGALSKQVRKLNLPLFGKRQKLEKTFGVPTKTESKLTTRKQDYKSDEEEIEEPEKPFSIGDTLNPKADTIRGPQIDPEMANEYTPNEMNSPMETSSTEISSLNEPADTVNSDKAPVAIAKKRKNRQRHRGKTRDNVDIDDSIEMDSDKYSAWVPPENQAGDGFTTLNDKFGY